jgi:ABC-2 type transport system ATP-binding protein
LTSTTQEQIIEVEFDRAINSEVIHSISGLTAATNRGGNLWELTFLSEQDMRSVIFDFAQEHGLKTLQLNLKNRNLESLFREVTGKE